MNRMLPLALAVSLADLCCSGRASTSEGESPTSSNGAAIAPASAPASGPSVTTDTVAASDATEDDETLTSAMSSSAIGSDPLSSSATSAAAESGGQSSESCNAAEACGGDVSGTWQVSGSCLGGPGTLDLRGFGLGCLEGEVQGSLTVEGSLTFAEDGTLTDATRTTGELSLTFEPECFEVAAVGSCERLGVPLINAFGFAACACEVNDAGGCECACEVDQAGAAGFITAQAATTGTYTTADRVLSLMAGSERRDYAFCARDSVLTLHVPSAPTARPVSGTIVLVRP